MRKLMAAAGLAVWMGQLVSCTEVDLCREAHPHHSYLDFRFNWKEEYKDAHGDSMRIIAVRPVNIMRYEFRVTSQEEDNVGVMLSPEEEADECRKLMQTGAIIDPGRKGSNLWVRPGEYNFATFAWDSNMLSDVTELLGATDEQEELGSDFSHLLLSYRPFDVTEPQVKGRYGDWIDYNPYSQYISSFGMKIYYAYANHVNVPVPEEGTGVVRVDFTPEPATQRITFRFDIEKTADLVVDSLVAEISGIPSTIDLTSGVITADKTYKMLFQPEYPELPSYTDSLTAGRLECEGDVDVTGIMRGYNDEMITGPGILQVGIYARTLTDDGQKVYKLFRAGINLFHTLKDLKILEWDEEVQGYRQTCREAVISISSTLKVNKDGVVNEGTGSTGLDEWTDGGDVDLDV